MEQETIQGFRLSPQQKRLWLLTSLVEARPIVSVVQF